MHFIRVKVTPLSIGQTLTQHYIRLKAVRALSIGQTLTQHYIRLKAVRALSIGQTLTTLYIRLASVKRPVYMSHVDNGIFNNSAKLYASNLHR